MLVDALRDPLNLLGDWHFRRVIDDHLANERSRVVGTLTIVADGDRIRWSESGELDWRGEKIEVSRVNFLQRRAGGWFVTFEDGRDFHPWAPGEPVVHDCGAAVYRGCVLQGSRDSAWTVEWHVEGPNKDYTMTTELSPPAA